MKVFLKEPPKRAPELYVYDEVGSPWSMSPVTIQTVRDRLNAIGDAPEMVCRINSVGGDVHQGMAIYSALREFAGKKIGVVEGLAASIASVILMACDEIVMTEGSFLMIHNPHAVSQGGSADLRRTADLMDEMRAQMLKIYQERSKLPMAEIEAMVDAETYLTAEEAVAKGFADRVSSTGARIAASAIKTLARPPEALRRTALAQEQTMDEEEKKMKAELAASKEECAALKAKLAKFEKEDDDEDEDEDEDEESSTGTGEGAKASLQMARIVMACSKVFGETDLEKLEGRVMASGGVAVATDLRALVEKAVSDGVMPPSMKAWALAKKTPRAAVEEFVRSASPTSVVAAKAQPAVGAPAAVPAGAPSATVALSALEKEIQAKLGLSDAEMVQARAAKPRAIPSAADIAAAD